MTVTDYQKPIPVPSVESRPYWTGLNEGRLQLPKCRSCSHCWFPPSLLCPSCNSDDFSWEPSTGQGKVFSFVVFHRVYHPSFADEVPYVVALIELEEGPRLISNLIGIDADQVQCEMPVQISFDKITNDITLPKFVRIALRQAFP